LMRLAPVVLFCHPDLQKSRDCARRSSATTHAAAEALDACELFAVFLGNALCGMQKEDVLRCCHSFGSPAVQALAGGGDRAPGLSIGDSCCSSICRPRQYGLARRLEPADAWQLQVVGTFVLRSTFSTMLRHFLRTGYSTRDRRAVAQQL
jgi:hypothetical protein